MHEISRDSRIATIESRDLRDPRCAYEAAQLLLDTIIEVVNLSAEWKEITLPSKPGSLFFHLPELKQERRLRLPVVLQEFNSDLHRLDARRNEVSLLAAQVRHPERPSLFGYYKESYLEAVHDLAMGIVFDQTFVVGGRSLNESERLNRFCESTAWKKQFEKEFLNLRVCLRTELRDILGAKLPPPSDPSDEKYLGIYLDGQRQARRKGYEQQPPVDLTPNRPQWIILTLLYEKRGDLLSADDITDEFATSLPTFIESEDVKGRFC